MPITQELAWADRRKAAHFRAILARTLWCDYLKAKVSTMYNLWSTNVSVMVLSNRFTWETPVCLPLHPAARAGTLYLGTHLAYRPRVLLCELLVFNLFNLFGPSAPEGNWAGDTQQQLQYQPQTIQPWWIQPHAHKAAIVCRGKMGQPHTDGAEKERGAGRDTVTLPVFPKWASVPKRLGTAAGEWMNFFFFAHSALVCGWADWIWSKQQEEDLPGEWKTASLRENKRDKNMTNSSENGTFLSKILSLWGRQCSLCEPHYIHWHTSLA